MRARVILAMTAMVLATAGCTYDEMVRSETMTAAAGNAQAYNMRLQIIDPMPPSAANTALALPATSYGAGSDGASGGSASGLMEVAE